MLTETDTDLQETTGNKLPALTQSELMFWRNEIEASNKRYQSEFVAQNDYDLLTKYFEGIQKGQYANIDRLLVLDELSPSITSIISNVYYQNPKAIVTAKNPQADKDVQPGMLYLLQHPEFVPFKLVDLLNGALNYVVSQKEGGLKPEAQIAIFDLLVAGFCVIECNQESTPVPMQMDSPEPGTPAQSALTEKFPSSNSGLGRFLGDATKFIRDPLGRNPENKMTTEDVESYLFKEQDKVVGKFGYKDKIYFRRWAPTDILFDSKADRFCDSRFIAKKIDMSIAEYKAKYPQNKDYIPADSTLDMSYQSHRDDSNKKAVRLYELQVKKNDGIEILILGMGVPKALDRYILPFRTNGFTLKYGCLDNYGKLYPVSRTKKAKKSQDALNALATQQMEHALRASRKVAVSMGNLSEAGKRDLNNGLVYGFVEKTTPGAIFEKVPLDPVNNDNLMLQRVLSDSINKQIGTNELAKAGKSENEFATQDTLQAQQFLKNANQVRDALGDVIAENLDTAKDIIQQTYDGQDYFKITGIKGADAWYSPEMGPLPDLVLGDYLVDVNITSASRPDPLLEQNKAVKLLEIATNPNIQQFAMMNGKRFNMEALNGAIKSLEFEPDSILEDLPPPQMMLPPPGAEGLPPGEGEQLPPGGSPDVTPPANVQPNIPEMGPPVGPVPPMGGM